LDSNFNALLDLPDTSKKKTSMMQCTHKNSEKPNEKSRKAVIQRRQTKTVKKLLEVSPEHLSPFMSQVALTIPPHIFLFYFDIALKFPIS